MLGLAAAALVVAAAAPARAGIIVVTSRADLGANDFIDWGQLGPNGTVVLSDVGTTPVGFPSSGSIVTDDGIGVTALAVAGLTEPVTIPLAVDQLGGLPSIKLGDVTVPNFNPLRYGPGLTILLTFDEPVFAVGADISSYVGNAFGTDRTHLRVDALSQSGPVIGGTGDLFTVPSGPFDGFIGLKTDSAVADIFGIRIQAFDTALEGGEHSEKVRLEVNRLDILNGSPQNAAVPEPSSLTLLGFGSLALVGYAWRRRKRANAPLHS